MKLNLTDKQAQAVRYAITIMLDDDTTDKASRKRLQAVADAIDEEVTCDTWIN